MLEWISKKFVVLWDEGDKRGWLVNGTSALLHLVRASLEQNRTGKFRSVYTFRPDQLVEAASPHTPDSALEVLMHPQNRKLKIYDESGEDANEDVHTNILAQRMERSYYCFQDRVEQLYESLEKMIDYEINANGQQGVKVKFRARTHLEGWDFKDLAMDNDPFYPRVARLQAIGKGWVDFTRSIHAIVLFGKKFGEIIQPAETCKTCDYWAQVPKGTYYLAVSVPDLNEIIDMHGDPQSNPLRICNDIFWHSPDPGDGQCCCMISHPRRTLSKSRNEHSDFSQVLLPSTLSRIIPKRSPRREKLGAVIFGHNMNFPWYWKDHGDPEPGEPPDVAGISKTPRVQSNDSDIGSSLGSLSAGDAERLSDAGLEHQKSSQTSRSLGEESSLSPQLASSATTMENQIPRGTQEPVTRCDSSCESVAAQDATAAPASSKTKSTNGGSRTSHSRVRNRLRHIAALRSRFRIQGADLSSCAEQRQANWATCC